MWSSELCELKQACKFVLESPKLESKTDTQWLIAQSQMTIHVLIRQHTPIEIASYTTLEIRQDWNEGAMKEQPLHRDVQN